MAIMMLAMDRISFALEKLGVQSARTALICQDSNVPGQQTAICLNKDLSGQLKIGLADFP
jgi:hypothetical protein